MELTDLSPTLEEERIWQLLQQELPAETHESDPQAELLASWSKDAAVREAARTLFLKLLEEVSS